MRYWFGITLFAIGMLMAGWHGYRWWEESTAVIVDRTEARSVSLHWEDTTIQEPMPHKTTSEDQSRVSAAQTFTTGEKIAELTIPKLDRIYPVFWGTDKETLQQGIGMYDSPSMAQPDQLGHTGLAGHRDTVFVGLDTLQPGDRIYLDFQDQTYEYQIRKTWITDANDRSVLTEKQAPTLTLTTCYPFNFIGSAPDRFIIQADLIGKQTLEGSAT
ncbi:class D sortase [Sediminibacillus dalangtanensis]|uniref:Class D sortase n=1 Tax=Sediminibacillus dalangtanensis TaxID=2729421 RepID=A0ABX7VXT3_9BACI|nr:class D sortase [Sediminibacillus dalangtanensis]QTN00571.1 class D sortase [Sediminibacillus dalangtanensis]